MGPAHSNGDARRNTTSSKANELLGGGPDQPRRIKQRREVVIRERLVLCALDSLRIKYRDPSSREMKEETI